MTEARPSIPLNKQRYRQKVLQLDLRDGAESLTGDGDVATLSMLAGAPAILAART